MTTSDIAFERVQALLKIDAGGGSLHEHFTRIVRKLVEEQPSDALAHLEGLSRRLKDGVFRGVPEDNETQTENGSESQPVVLDAVAEEKRLRWCADLLELVQPKQPYSASSSARLCNVVDFVRHAAMFEWCGIGFGQQESFKIMMSLQRLAAQTPGLQRLRFWGKVLGIEGDYYIAEGLLATPSFPSEPAKPDTPEFDVERRGEGANQYTYWVSPNSCAPWVRLPAVRASHIVVARSIQRLMTGHLESPVLSMPWFPGSERHFLRAQIARISATCSIAPDGWYVLDEDEKNKIKEVPAAERSLPDDLALEDSWLHCAPALRACGKSTSWSLEALRDIIPPEQYEALENEENDENLPDILGPISKDFEQFDNPVGWSIKVFGDEAWYHFEESEKKKSHRVIGVRSNVWPGACAVTQGGETANIYIGYGLKCGSLVPRSPKSGLSLKSTFPFSPLAPEPVLDEPRDLEERDEPNPQEDDAVSDKLSIDADD